ncbi:TetR/AcrR family transcriptional regulator [Nocardioides sp. InS609-2]|uniref:TetR/AcrR family transcriptional regulator n=1 Tax=Nocardioides sp. InS609-2 TaxID=2760705 RepID=UPI0020BD50DA|nr:TetR/AcrR family transcriptional regulator [Nocardioides sp. InS609-2]
MPTLRADARRNHQQVLEAAREVVLAHGPNVPLDVIAKEAGVGIGTLYRRFTDREGLLRAVVLDALTRAREVAERALDEHEQGYDALAAYLRGALELRVSALIPMVLDRLDPADAELTAAREAGAAVLETIIDTAHQDGTLPHDIDFGDIGPMLVRLSRPLPGTLPTEVDLRLARRQLDLLLLGIQHASDDTLGAPGLTRKELRVSDA